MCVPNVPKERIQKNKKKKKKLATTAQNNKLEGIIKQYRLYRM